MAGLGVRMGPAGRAGLAAAAIAVACLMLAQAASAATKVVEVTPALKIIKGVKNGPPEWTCYDDVVADWEAWDSATAWLLEWDYNGTIHRVRHPSPPFHDEFYLKKTPPGASPSPGHHWSLLEPHSASNFSGPATCTAGEVNKARISSLTLQITVDKKDPGPDEDDDDDADNPEPPPDELTPPPPPPPPDDWKFDARRSTVTLVGCEPGAKVSKPWPCTAAVWDAHPDDPDASAPTGDVVWFAPNGKLSDKRCTLKQATAVASSCTTTFKPSSKTHKDKKQPVEGGYQGSKIHRPSSGVDGERPIPVPLDWEASKRKVAVSLYCGGGKTCKGKATLKAAKGSSAGDSATAAKKKKKLLGKSGYKIKSGQTKSVKIKLNRKGRKALKRSKPAKLVLAPKGAKKLKHTEAVRLAK